MFEADPYEVSSMGTRKRIAAAISGLAFAGTAVLTLGAAPASAQTVTTAPHHSIATPARDCDWDWNWRYCDRWDGWHHRRWHDGDGWRWSRWDRWHHWNRW